MWKVLTLLKFGKFFSSNKFMGTVGRMGRNVIYIRKAVTLFYCFRDPETPKFVKAVIAGALGYLILPIDLLPDVVPALGWIDDAAVMALAMKVASRYIKPVHRESGEKFMPVGSE